MPYHHGQLRSALIDAAVEQVRAGGGPEELSLRELSRRVGVSHNAAYRHFPDRDALAVQVRRRGMALLAALMEQGLAETATPNERVHPATEHGPAELVAALAAQESPASLAVERLSAVGRAYVSFALAEPGLFRAAFSGPGELDLDDPGLDPEPGSAGGNDVARRAPHVILASCLDDLVATGVLPVERRPGAELGAWSAVHGYAALLLDGPLRSLSAAERETGLGGVLTMVLAGL